MYRFPEGPPFAPISPSPVSLTCMPFWTPAGIDTAVFRFFRCSPDALQVPQGEAIIFPLP